MIRVIESKSTFSILFIIINLQNVLGACSTDIQQRMFKRQSISGHSLVGNSVHRFTSRRFFYCIHTCTNMPYCRYLKITSNHINHTDVNFQCEVFDCSVTLVMTNQEPSNDVTIYKANHTEVRDCMVVRSNCGTSGIHSITPIFGVFIQAYCDMETTDGGWTVLQRRNEGSFSFYRNWESYKNGFGSLDGEFWLGLDAAHWLTRDGNATLRFDLWDGTNHYYMEYYNVMIESEAYSYRLDYDGISGDAGDAMTRQSKGQYFSTKDRDNDVKNDGNCAIKCFGGWWYGNCQDANLNGKWGSTYPARGINWLTITGKSRSLSKTEMKIKRSK